MDLDESMAGLPVNEIERRAAACSEAWTAYAEEASLPHEHAPRREAYEKASGRFGTGRCARGVLTLIARVRAAEAERDRLRADLDEAYPRALQAAADVALRCEPHALADLDSSEAMEWIDNLANDILDLSADEIDALAEQQAEAHGAESGER